TGWLTNSMKGIFMRISFREVAKLILAGALLVALAHALLAPSAFTQTSPAPKKRIVVEGSKIVAIDAKAGPVDYDLDTLTVLPGWIDAHVHITWSFGKDGK